MNKQIFTPERDGFCGAWYPVPKQQTDRAVILMLGDSSEDRMATVGAKWLHRQGCHALAMSADKKDYGHHNYPLERFGKAIEFLKSQGCGKIGIIGASTTGMLALVAASYYPEISLTIAVSPPDFIMEGFYQDGRDGMRERPGDNESECRHPLQEEEKIKVERICGRVICIGAEDDVLWDTCKYIRRMEQRLCVKPHESKFEAWLYKHGTHFAFPESMLKMMIPVGSALLVRFMFRAGKEYPKECRETRIDIDRRLQRALQEW